MEALQAVTTELREALAAQQEAITLLTGQQTSFSEQQRVLGKLHARSHAAVEHLQVTVDEMEASSGRIPPGQGKD